MLEFCPKCKKELSRIPRLDIKYCIACGWEEKKKASFQRYSEPKVEEIESGKHIKWNKTIELEDRELKNRKIDKSLIFILVSFVVIILLGLKMPNQYPDDKIGFILGGIFFVLAIVFFSKITIFIAKKIRKFINRILKKEEIGKETLVEELKTKKPKMGSSITRLIYIIMFLPIMIVVMAEIYIENEKKAIILSIIFTFILFLLVLKDMRDRLKKKGIYEEGNFSLYILKVVITLIILGGLYHFVPEMIRKLQLF
ncbi:MAG: hypothetical protein KBE24_04685 [Fusobacteriaceae bacterium]|nr:hypothetical protein [Fusobacteriaceae bacterium]